MRGAQSPLLSKRVVLAMTPLVTVVILLVTRIPLSDCDIL